MIHSWQSRLFGPNLSRSWLGKGLVLSLLSMGLSGCFADKAPQLTFTTITGSTLAPTDYANEVLLVNFWATSCTTCIKEMPDLVKTHEKFAARGYRTIAVAMSYDRPDYVVNYVQTNKLPFDVVLDLKGDIAKQYKDVQLTPTTFLVNKQGEILKTYIGPPDFNALHALIEKALNNG